MSALEDSIIPRNIIAALQGFIEAMPESHLAYFYPHGFGRADLMAVLRSRSFMTYGLFVGDALAAYALLKLAPTGSAFIGLLVGSEHTGKGLGRFIVAYLYWQACAPAPPSIATTPSHGAPTKPSPISRWLQSCRTTI